MQVKAFLSELMDLTKEKAMFKMKILRRNIRAASL